MAAQERELCSAKYSSQVQELRGRVEGYLQTRAVLEERCAALAKELAVSE